MRPGDDEYKLRDIFRNFDVISSHLSFRFKSVFGKTAYRKTNI